MNTGKQEAIDCKQKLVRSGLERSCESLGFFLKEKVELEGLYFSDTAPQDIHTVMESRQKEIILYSEIIGQVSGQCFFLLDLSEADMLFRKNFSASQNETPQKLIFEGFLLEMDNIITASVVTEFANFMRVQIFGGIPNIIYQEEVNKLRDLSQKAASGMFSINFKCQYKINGIEFSPVFYWIFEPKFAELIHARCS